MRVAVVDVGSNSIKSLVASRTPEGRLVEVGSRTLDVRMGSGIGSDRPRLSRDAIERGVAAVENLASEARGLGAGRIIAVATSAVRDAANGKEFLDEARSATGLDIRVLTGPEEAALIGRGLATDPALGELLDFHVYDLGGGSLECLSFRNRAVERAVSLPLGCVRLTERFVPRPSAPFAEEVARAIGGHVRDVLRASDFELPVPQGFAVVGTGGTLTAVRAIVAARSGAPFEEASPLVGVPLLREVLASVGPMGLAERRRVPGLPPARADVFPAALAVFLALADLGAIQAFHHSLRNLRWGVAAESLG
ncbi:MAG TPA: phosphatase [Opitutaceae bacterium]|nr:phosphatase [Opitutaceae bacterium]